MKTAAKSLNRATISDESMSIPHGGTCRVNALQQECVGNYVSGLCDDRLIDFSVFDDPKERAHWKKMFDFRRNQLHLSEEKANEWTIRSIKHHYRSKDGEVEDPSAGQLDPEFSIRNQPLSDQEREIWNQRMKFRTNTLGLSKTKAAEWTRRTIEMDRQLSAKIEMNGLFDHAEIGDG